MASSRPSVPVLYFGHPEGAVEWMTVERAREAIEETCRAQGHYFASVWPVTPHPSDHCLCGDITFKEWKP